MSQSDATTPLTTSLAGRVLGFALRAAGASEATAGPAARATAFANLQRLRHLLEDGPAHVPVDIIVRALELIAPYTHGTRMMNRDVDADAVRIAIMLFGMGGVEALAEQQCGLLESYGAVFSARARARPHLAAEAKHWKTSAFLCDLCGMAVAVMAVEVVRLQQSSDDAVLRTRVAPLGRTLHETMSTLSNRGMAGKNGAKANLKHDDAISVLDKVQAAYMRVLRPDAWYSRVGGSGRWVSVAMPAMLAAGVWYEGGWDEFRRNDNGVLTIIGVLLLLCSTLPWVAPLLLKRDHRAAERAARVSEMLVEMAMYLRPAGGGEGAGGSGSGGGTTAVWGEYMFGVFDEVGGEVGGNMAEEDRRSAEGHTCADTGDREGDVREMLASVRGLGNLVVHAIKADETAGAAMGAPALPADEDEEENVLQREDGELSVQVPFPPEMLEKMVTLEKMLREQGGAPEEIAKAAERVQLLKRLLERG